MTYLSNLNKILRELDDIVERYYHAEDRNMYYADYRRRTELLVEIISRIDLAAKVLDAGCMPGFTSLALKLLGYNVVCLDLDPKSYQDILKAYGCEVVKVDLENDTIPLSQESVDAIIFTEVLEHLNPYYVSWTLSELNRILKPSGLLFLSTPNIASIGKRVKLLLGKNPLGQTHVKEYTRDEVLNLLADHGFKFVNARYSMAYDLTPYHAKDKDYLLDLLRATIKYRTKENLFKLISLPWIKILPFLRATIFVIAEKTRPSTPKIITKRF